MKQFFEFPQLKDFALVTNPEELFNKAAAPGKAHFTITSEVGDFVRNMALAPIMPALKECKFQLIAENGQGFEYITFDKKGTPNKLEAVPEWSMNENEYARSVWVSNKGFDVRSGVELLAELVQIEPIEERRKIANLLLNLGLDKPRHRLAAYHNTGNRNGLSTKPKVCDLGSFEMFQQFFDRLADIANNNQFASITALTGYDDASKAPTNVKQACRTYYKAITGEVVPNNKVLKSGDPATIVAKIKERQAAILSAGIEDYYKQLQEAIAEAQKTDVAVSDFQFTHPEVNPNDYPK